MADQGMVLVGRYRSPFTRRVAVSLRLLGFDYDLRPRTAWRHFDEITSLNPVGRVPILILEDGELIFDSSAILDYLDGRVGPDRALVPEHGPTRRRVQTLVALALGVVDKGRDLLYETVLRPEALRHGPWIERWEGQIGSALGAMETDAQAPWIAGERLTQADVTAGVMVDFTRLYHPRLLPQGQYRRLDELSAAYGDVPAFAETMPEPE